MTLILERHQTQSSGSGIYKRGDIFMADLSFVVGAEQGGSVKPVVILQNDIGNKFSPTVIVAVLTSRVKKHMVTHVYLDAVKNGLEMDSIVLLEQIKTIDKRRLMFKMTSISEEDMKNVEIAIKASLGLE